MPVMKGTWKNALNFTNCELNFTSVRMGSNLFELISCSKIVRINNLLQKWKRHRENFYRESSHKPHSDMLTSLMLPWLLWMWVCYPISTISSCGTAVDPGSEGKVKSIFLNQYWTDLKTCTTVVIALKIRTYQYWKRPEISDLNPRPVSAAAIATRLLSHFVLSSLQHPDRISAPSVPH